MKREIETINKNQEEMNNKMSEIKNTLEGNRASWMKERMESVTWRTR